MLRFRVKWLVLFVDTTRFINVKQCEIGIARVSNPGNFNFDRLHKEKSLHLILKQERSD